MCFSTFTIKVFCLHLMTYQNSTINPDDQRGEDVYDSLLLELTMTPNIIELDDRRCLHCVTSKSSIWMCQNIQMDHESPMPARYNSKESGLNNFISLTITVSSPFFHNISICYSIHFAAIHGVAKSRTRLSDWTELNWLTLCLAN